MTPCRAVIRVRVPDRPGALGLVASRIGAVKGDIASIEVVDRQDGTALDELAVVLPDASLVPAVEREIAEVDGVAVAGVEIVDAFPEPRLDEIRFAVALSQARDASSPGRPPGRAGVRGRPSGVVPRRGPGVDAGTGSSTVPETETVIESVDLTVSGITLSFGRLTTLQRRERAIVSGYCDLADALWLRLPHETTAGDG